MSQVRKVIVSDSANSLLSSIGDWFLNKLIKQCRCINYFDKLEFTIADNSSLILIKDDVKLNLVIDVVRILTEMKKKEKKEIKKIEQDILEFNLNRLNKFRDIEVFDGLKIPFEDLKTEMLNSEKALSKDKRYCVLMISTYAKMSYESGPISWKEFVKIFDLRVRQEITC